MDNLINNFVNKISNSPGLIKKLNFDISLLSLLDEDNKQKYTNTPGIEACPEVPTVSIEDAKVEQFASLLLCGGKATRFNNIYKSIYQIENALLDGVNRTFLELNILQIVNFEKKYKIKIPIIIYDDFGTHDSIVNCLKENNYFGKNKKDFYYVKQASSLRYIPSVDFLKKVGLIDTLDKDERKLLPEKTSLFQSKKIEDSIIGTGHFVFNALINSADFKEVIVNNPNLKRIVVSNCDNLGSKYFGSLLTSKSGNHIITARRNTDEKMDGVYKLNNKNIIIPHFKQKAPSSSVGFTGSIYMTIDLILNLYGFNSKEKFISNKAKIKGLRNQYYPILKRAVLANKRFITVHFESVLAEISNFSNFTPVNVDRNRGFYPFKSIDDINEDYLSKWRLSVNLYNYL